MCDSISAVRSDAPSPPAQAHCGGSPCAAMSAEPADRAPPSAVGAAGGDGLLEPRRRRSVRSQSALAVMGRMGGSPYSIWASSYLHSRNEAAPAANAAGGDNLLATAAAATDRQPPPPPPLPPNPFNIEGGALAGWRPRGNLSEVHLRLCEEGQAGADCGAGRKDWPLPEAAADAGETAVRWQPFSDVSRPTSRRHSDASVMKCATPQPRWGHVVTASCSLAGFMLCVR